jgi:hypothetical protein
VGVPAQDRVDAAHARGELEIDVHAVVGKQHHDLRALRPGRVDVLLQFLFLDPHRPIGNEVARVRDGRVRERLPDDRHRHAVDGAGGRRLEHRVAEVGGLHVLRQELDPAELLLDRLLDALLAVGELPVAGHEVDAEVLLGLDHVGALRPQRESGALPGVAAVEKQRAGPLRAQALYQRREMREAADLAVRQRGPFEVEEGERVGFARARLDPERLEEMLADEVGGPTGRGADADVDARLAEVDRQELRVAVGEMQQRDVAEPGNPVQGLRARLRERLRRIEGEPGRRGGREHFEEFAAVHCCGSREKERPGEAKPFAVGAPGGYLFTGELGSIR